MAKLVAVSVLAIGSLSVCSAELDGDAVCMSLCGMLDDSTKNCRLTTADKGNCNRLFFNPSNELVYEAGIMPGYRAITVHEAINYVRAEDDNCYAMCYENSQCRSVGSYCSDNGVCKGLFWNTFDKRDKSAYSFMKEKYEHLVNEASPVMCDPKIGNEPEILDYPDVIDTCQALCSLSHTADECKRVYRVGFECYRLYWENDQKDSTVFSVKRVKGVYPLITIQEAFDLLLATDNSCENLCRRHPQCKHSDAISECNEVNRSCRGLFYYPGTIAKDELKICFGESCSEASPVTCRLPNDKLDMFKKPAMKNGKAVKNAANKADGAVTTTKDSSSVSTSLLLAASMSIVGLFL